MKQKLLGSFLVLWPFVAVAVIVIATGGGKIMMVLCFLFFAVLSIVAGSDMLDRKR